MAHFAFKFGVRLRTLLFLVIAHRIAVSSGPRWLQRFVETGLQIHADEVIAQGPPWNTTVCVRGTDHLDTEDGRVYENRYVIWGRIAWGRLREYEVYEDTQKAVALDAWLAEHEPALAA